MGSYDVYASWVAHPKKHASNAPFTVFDRGFEEGTVFKDQQVAPGVDGWNLLGTYDIDNGSLKVRLTNNANGTVIADAIRIVPVSQTAPAGWQGSEAFQAAAVDQLFTQSEEDEEDALQEPLADELALMLMT